MAKLTALTRAHPDAASVLTLILLSLVLMGRGLVPGSVFSPADLLFVDYPWKALAPDVRPINPLLTDVTTLFQPWLIYTAREIASGRFPLWNPHVFAGAPFFANPQSALLFPLTWLAFVLPLQPALALIAAGKLAAAGLSMYAFLRLRGVHPVSGILGATSFMLSAVVIVWLQWSYASVLIFFPLLFAMAEYLRAREGRRPVALAALVVMLAALAGYPQAFVLALGSATAWAFYRARGAGVGYLIRFAGAVGLGVALAAIQLVPFIEYARHSFVLARRSEWLPPLAASLRSAITLLMPYYYGSPTTGEEWGEWNFNEVSASVGLAPLVLLPAALVARRPGRVFFAVMALGAGCVFYGAAAAWLDSGFFVIGFRYAALLTFALCVLSALGMDAIVTASRSAGNRITWAVTIGFVGIVTVAFVMFAGDYATMRLGTKISGVWNYLAFLTLITASAVLALTGLRRGGMSWALTLVGIQLASLAPLAATYNPVIEGRLFYPTPRAIARVQYDAGREYDRVLMAANLGMVYGVSGVAGYDGMIPRYLADVIRPPVSNTLDLVGGGYLSEVSVYFSPVRDLLGIRHILVPPGVKLESPGLALDYQDGDGWIYRNESALPRTFVVANARCLDDEQILRLIREHAIDLRREALLSDCVTPSVRNDGTEGGTAVIDRYEPHAISITATSERGGYLVLTDTWFPGWTARIDGAPVRIERADYAFRAVWLEPGRHYIDFRYEPGSIRLGLAITATAALAVVALALPSRRPPPNRESC